MRHVLSTTPQGYKANTTRCAARCATSSASNRTCGRFPAFGPTPPCNSATVRWQFWKLHGFPSGYGWNLQYLTVSPTVAFAGCLPHLACHFLGSSALPADPAVSGCLRPLGDRSAARSPECRLVPTEIGQAELQLGDSLRRSQTQGARPQSEVLIFLLVGITAHWWSRRSDELHTRTERMWCGTALSRTARPPAAWLRWCIVRCSRAAEGGAKTRREEETPGIGNPLPRKALRGITGHPPSGR